MPTIYKPPHRSWIKLSALGCPSSLSSGQIDWIVQNIDMFSWGGSAAMKSRYDAECGGMRHPYYELWERISDSTLTDYCTAHSLNIETMFLHWSETTIVGGVSMPGDGTSAGRVRGVGNSADGPFVLNLGNANCLAFVVWEQCQLAGSAGFSATGGFFYDNARPYVLAQTTFASSGGHIAEYSQLGVTAGQASLLSSDSKTALYTAHDALHLSAFVALRTAFGSKGTPSKDILANITVYDWNISYTGWSIYPSCDGMFRESCIIAGTNGATDRVAWAAFLTYCDAARAAGCYNSIHTINAGTTASDQPGDKIYSLAMYYIAADPTIDYYCRTGTTGTYSADPAVTCYFPALDYNVGKPVGARSTPNTGDGTQGADPAHSAYTYKVWMREYDNAIMVGKPLSYYASSSPAPDQTSASNTTHALPKTSDNPAGIYYALNADGTVNLTPVTSVTLANGAGAIMIKMPKYVYNSATAGDDC